jgi:beta-galactosidase
MRHPQRSLLSISNRSHWRPDTPTVHILPHWSWPDRLGKPVPVFVYTNGDSAELFLNGKSLGRRTKGQMVDRPSGESSYYDPTYTFRLRWNEVIYEPGELKAVAFKNGEKIGASIMRTAAEPAALRLTPDRTELSASGDDLCYVLVEAVDEHGTLCPLADNEIRFAISGAAEIIGVGNGNPLSLEPFQSDQSRLFYGKSMLIVRTIDGRAGEFEITASSPQLRSATASGHTRGLASK